jgi:hypothetical protein
MNATPEAISPKEVSQSTLTVTAWSDIKDYTDNKWLVHGLLTEDDSAGFSGKPKSGKSTAIRNLAAAVIRGGTFLGREILLPTGSGRVLYLHLDRKDQAHQVKRELRNLGVTDDNSDRLRFLTAQNVPKNSTNVQLCDWLVRHVKEFRPNLIFIDLFTNFLRCRKGVSDYDGMQEAITLLQDKLKESGCKGALVVSLHARKATSEEDAFDNILGTTSIRGCLSTILAFRQYKKQKTYTVQSDQTQRDQNLGELDETVVNRDPQGAIHLGVRFEDVKQEEKKDEYAVRLNKLFNIIATHDGELTADAIADHMKMAKKTLLPLLESMEEAGRIYPKGLGKRGDPKKYCVSRVVVGGKVSHDPDTVYVSGDDRFVKCETSGCMHTARVDGHCWACSKSGGATCNK